ncbi:PREDICTED: serine protease easter-like [Polistes dominula]|uniref:Serine protease easter-like n=1 Tax=Polistes dominula TaxID=743375 RepID=A0ABM1HST1_POLDO|nr:PREDICTED: serine protease easter-like [Polistes dominula]
MYVLFTAVATFYISSFSIVDAQSFNCTTPNGIAGNCISIYQCTPLLKKLEEKPLRKDTIDYLKDSQCGFDELVPLVCCPPNINSSNPNLNTLLVTSTDASISTLKNVNCSDDIMKFLENSVLLSECGRDSIPRNLESANTSPGEFPWMALLEYKTANCLMERPLSILSNVRFGVHDLCSSTNCVKRDDENICSDGSISVEIEESFIHVLFELHLEINFNYEIRLVHLKVSVQLFDKDSYNSLYRYLLKREFGVEQIRAGGEKGRDACYGDSGGLLMGFRDLPNNDKIWTAVGIVSVGPSNCGPAGLPSVYTNVYDFIPWIISKMRP